MSTTLESTEALILSGEGYSLEVAPSVLEQKAELIKFSALIVSVKDAISSEAAGHQIKKLAAMRNLVEKSRTTVKAPVLAVGKRIDDLAKEFAAEITAEEARLKKLQGEYAEEVIRERQRVLREQEAQRQAERNRLLEEAAAAAKAEHDRIAAEETARIAREAAEQAAWEAVSEEDEADAKRKADEAQRIADEAAAAEKERLRIAADEAARVADLPVAAPTFVPEVVKGVKMVPDYVVEDIDALYRHNAGLVSLIERRKEILDAIARGMIGDTPPTIPGLRIFMRPQVR